MAKNRLGSEVKENGDQMWSEKKKDETWECDPENMNQTSPADAPSLHTHIWTLKDLKQLPKVVLHF